MSDLLRERLGPSSSYVESLIAIQRAYINTNHPNFLGAAAAMSSVINSKQEKEKKAALAEERRKRERRRLKDMGVVNGTETPEDDDGEEEKSHGLPVRQHLQKGSRSLSPAVRGLENGHATIHSTMNGRAGSPPRGSGTGAARDSFLNYFFGKEGGLPGGNGVSAGQAHPSMAAGGHRHVSHNIEPSFAQSIRRGENRIMERSPPQHDLDTTYDSSPTTHREYDYSLFVRSFFLFSHYQSSKILS